MLEVVSQVTSKTSRASRDIRAHCGKGLPSSRQPSPLPGAACAGKVSGIRTYLSHGDKDYGDALLARVAQQLHISKRELLELVERMDGMHISSCCA